MAVTSNNPETTYTLEDFITEGRTNELTYQNFCVKDQSALNYTKISDGAPTDKNNITFCTTDVLDFYLDNLKTVFDANTLEGNCIKVTEFSDEDIANFKYQPDLLSYYLYGTTQLDWVIMLCNGIIDPKEFDFKRGYLLLPRRSIINDFLSAVHNSEQDWLDKGKK